MTLERSNGPRIRKVLRLAIISLVCTDAVLCHASESVYVDASNPQNGDGSEASPFQRLALIDWQFVSNRIAAGAQVSVKLKRGSTFRENLTLGASGSDLAPVIITSYGEGPAPIIRGDTAVTGWTAQSTNPAAVWYANWPSPVSYVWLDGTYASKGASVESLQDRQWFSVNNRLYLRNDSGHPEETDLTVTASVRNSAAVISGRSHVRLEQLDLRHSASYLLRVVNSADVEIRGCQLSEAGGLLDVNSSTNARILGCNFDGAYGWPILALSGSATTATLMFSVLHNAASNMAVYVSACQRLDIVNCSLIGARTRSIQNTSSGLVNIRNCLVTATGSRESIGSDTISSTAGTMLLGNSLVLPNGRNTALHLKGLVDLGGNVFGDPRFKQTRREGIWVIIEDDCGSLADWAKLARFAQTNYGYASTLALNSTDRIHPEHRELLQALITEGHDIVSHTRSHANLAQPDAFLIQYVGPGTNCGLTISNGWLRTAVGGGPTNEELDINLTAPQVARLENLIPFVDKLAAYTCAYNGSRGAYNHAVPVHLLEDTVNIEIKPTPRLIRFDRGRFYTNELLSSRTDIETSFTNSSGGPYSCKYLVYPGGYYNDEAITNAIATGYLGARIDSPTGGSWLMEKFDMFLAQVAVGINGHMLSIFFENSTSDSSPAQNSFSASAMGYSTNAYRLSYAGRFDGSNSFLSRIADAHFDFSKGDWHLSTHIWPDHREGTRTIFAGGSDSNTFFRVFLDSSGALHVRLVSDGAERLNLATRDGLIHNTGWQKISVQQLFDQWMIRVDDTLVLDARNESRLKPFSGDVRIGCDSDFPSSSRTGHYAGLMDDVVMSNGTFHKTQAVADLLCEVGGMGMAMSHGETGTPREVWRIVLDALKNYSGRLKVMPYTAACDYMYSQGQLQADGRTIVRTAWEGAANYGLRNDSPCLRAGDNAAVEGIPDLTDASGMPVTDGAGGILVNGGRLSIGALQPTLGIISEQLYTVIFAEACRIEFQSLGGVGAHQWCLAEASAPLPAGLLLSPEGVLSGVPAVYGTFNVTLEIRDEAGGVAQGAVTLLVQPHPRPILLFPQRQPDESFRFSVYSPLSATLTAEASSNLLDWVPVATIAVTNGTTQWSDLQATNQSSRYYRTRF
ncbi:MAG TPA: putative Ig domain-containing protein [Verrucomicrobiota bacterium]|nr:putative Ig domain-containing protein [Verrucomicrobiota bacterium]